MIRIFNRDFMQSGRQQGRRRFRTKFIIWAEFREISGATPKPQYNVC